MAIYRALWPARDYDRAHAGEDREVGLPWEQRPRLVTLDGRDYATDQRTLDLVASGAARFDRRADVRYFVTYEGRTLADRERNYSDDSDWYAVVWDDGELREVGYRTTRGAGTDGNYAVVDPTPEVLEEVRAWAAETEYARLRAAEVAAWRRDAADALVPRPGATVRVVRGRRVPLGAEGEVIWTGTDRFGNDRIGLRDAAGEVHWTAARNVGVALDPDDLPALAAYVRPEADVRAEARRIAEARWTDRGARLPVRIVA